MGFFSRLFNVLALLKRFKKKKNVEQDSNNFSPSSYAKQEDKRKELEQFADPPKKNTPKDTVIEIAEKLPNTTLAGTSKLNWASRMADEFHKVVNAGNKNDFTCQNLADIQDAITFIIEDTALQKEKGFQNIAKPLIEISNSLIKISNHKQTASPTKSDNDAIKELKERRSEMKLDLRSMSMPHQCKELSKSANKIYGGRGF